MLRLRDQNVISKYMGLVDLNIASGTSSLLLLVCDQIISNGRIKDLPDLPDSSPCPLPQVELYEGQAQSHEAGGLVNPTFTYLTHMTHPVDIPEATSFLVSLFRFLLRGNHEGGRPHPPGSFVPKNWSSGLSRGVNDRTIAQGSSFCLVPET